MACDIVGTDAGAKVTSQQFDTTEGQDRSLIHVPDMVAMAIAGRVPSGQQQWAK